MNGLVLSLCLIAAEPAPTPWDIESRLAAVEAKVSQFDQYGASVRVMNLEREVASLKAQLASCQCSAPAKAPVAVPEYTLTPSVKSNDAPTEHFAPGTTMVCGPNGCLTPSAAPVAVSYPGGPMFQPIQQGSCANGNCSPRRGLFRRW